MILTFFCFFSSKYEQQWYFDAEVTSHLWGTVAGNQTIFCQRTLLIQAHFLSSGRSTYIRTATLWRFSIPPVHVTGWEGSTLGKLSSINQSRYNHISYVILIPIMSSSNHDIIMSFSFQSYYHPIMALILFSSQSLIIQSWWALMLFPSQWYYHSIML